MKIRIPKRLLKQVAKTILGELLDVFLKAVKEVRDDPELLTGGKMKQKAVKIVKTAAKEKKIELKESLVNWGIETALQLVK